MKCPKCGKEIADNSQFCEFCGAEVGYSLSENDKMCLSIIRVAAEYESILASYKAREKCYKLTKESGGIKDYKLHVQQLQLDNYHSEFKKSLVGESYMKWLVGCIVGIVISLICAAVFWYFWYDHLYYYNSRSLLFTAIAATIVLIICLILLIRQTKIARKKIQEIKSKTVIMI